MNVKAEVVLEKFSNIIWEQKCWSILQEETSDELFDLLTDLEIDRLKWSWPLAPLAIGSFWLESKVNEMLEEVNLVLLEAAGISREEFNRRAEALLRNIREGDDKET